MIANRHEEELVHNFDATLVHGLVKPHLRNVAQVEKRRLHHPLNLKVWMVEHEESNSHEEGPPHEEDHDVRSDVGPLWIV